MTMETTQRDINTLAVSEDTAKLVRLLDTCSGIFDTVTGVFEKYYGDSFHEFRVYKNLLDALAAVEDAIGDTIGFSAQMRYKGVIGTRENSAEI